MLTFIHGWLWQRSLFNVITADNDIGKTPDTPSEIRLHGGEPEIQGGGAVTVGLIMLAIAAICGVIAYLAPHP